MPAGKVFVDTNVLVYAQDASVGDKQATSRALIATLGERGTGVVSTQVLQEFFVATTRKLGVAPLAAKGVLKTFAVFETVQVTPDLIHDAIDCAILNQLSFWDALILAAAAAASCTVIYSEDLQPGQMILGVTVRNPFADTDNSAPA